MCSIQFPKASRVPVKQKAVRLSLLGTAPQIQVLLPKPESLVCSVCPSGWFLWWQSSRRSARSSALSCLLPRCSSRRSTGETVMERGFGWLPWGMCLGTDPHPRERRQVTGVCALQAPTGRGRRKEMGLKKPSPLYFWF